MLGQIADVAHRTLSQDYRNALGAGAAGGLGFALIAFLGARVQPGVQLVARECGLSQLLSGATLCMTGEGKIDVQTLHGKTVDGVAKLANERGVAVVRLAARLEEGAAESLAPTRDRGRYDCSAGNADRGIYALGRALLGSRRKARRSALRVLIEVVTRRRKPDAPVPAAVQEPIETTPSRPARKPWALSSDVEAPRLMRFAHFGVARGSAT